jgi:hypothetical protein
VSQSATEKIPIIGSMRQAKKDNALAQHFKDQFDRCKNDRSQIERRWYLNYAFVSGRQNVQYIKSSTSTQNYRLFVPPAPSWRVRLIINKVRPYIRKELSKTTSQKPIFTVVPESNDEKDIMAARAAEAILLSAYRHKEIQSVLLQAGYWRSVTGIGFIKTWWDPNAIDTQSNQMGDICIERVRPYNIIIPDIMEEDIEKQPWVIHAWTQTPETAKERYNLDYLPEASVNAADDLMEESLISMARSGTNSRKEVLCLEVWIKPGKHPDFPSGGLITIVGDKLAQNVPQYPYDHGEYPFAVLPHIPTGQFYPESVITDLIPLQRELNRTRSQLVENKNITSRPRYWAYQGSMDVTKITGEPGQVFTINPGMQPPQLIEQPQEPQYVVQMQDQLVNDMDDITGQHEISRGGTPNSQVTAATAISFLQEQDDSLLAPTIEGQEAAIRKIGRQYLALAHQYWSSDRMVKTVGDDGYFDAQTFQGSSIQGTPGPINNDVVVEAGSSLSYSKAAKQAIIMDMMKNMLIDPQEGLRRMEFGGVEKLYEDIERDRRQATRENLKMAQGIQLQTNTWDNHVLHIDVHNNYRKTQEFEVLPPEIQGIFEQHVNMHTEAVTAQQPPPNPLMPQSNGLAQQPPVGNNGGQQQPPGLGGPNG